MSKLSGTYTVQCHEIVEWSREQSQARQMKLSDDALRFTLRRGRGKVQAESLYRYHYLGTCLSKLQ